MEIKLIQYWNTIVIISYISFTRNNHIIIISSYKYLIPTYRWFTYISCMYLVWPPVPYFIQDCVGILNVEFLLFAGMFLEVSKMRVMFQWKTMAPLQITKVIGSCISVSQKWTIVRSWEYKHTMKKWTLCCF